MIFTQQIKYVQNTIWKEINLQKKLVFVEKFWPYWKSETALCSLFHVIHQLGVLWCGHLAQEDTAVSHISLNKYLSAPQNTQHAAVSVQAQHLHKLSPSNLHNREMFVLFWTS